MMPNKSIYRDADAAEINLYELNFARFFSIQTSENGWRRVVCELVRRAAKGTKELRLEDGTELPGEKTFPDYVVDLMDSYLAVLPDAKPHAYPAAEREQLMERHCRHTEDGGIDYDYYQDMTLDTFIFNMRNVGAGALYAKRGPFWHGGHMEQCHFEELFRLIEEEGEKVFGETQERYADLAANDITAEAEHFFLAAIRSAIGAVVHLFQDLPRSRRQRNRYGGRAKYQREDGAVHEYPKRAAVPFTRKTHQGSGNCGFIFVVMVHSVFPPKFLLFSYTLTIGVPPGKVKEIFRIFFNFVCRGPYSYNERLKPRCFRAMIRWDFGKKEEVNTLWIWNK